MSATPCSSQVLSYGIRLSLADGQTLREAGGPGVPDTTRQRRRIRPLCDGGPDGEHVLALLKRHIHVDASEVSGLRRCVSGVEAEEAFTLVRLPRQRAAGLASAFTALWARVESTPPECRREKSAEVPETELYSFTTATSSDRL